MKKIIAVLGLVFSMQSFANIINIIVSDSDVEVGETIAVTLEGKHFEAFEAFDTFSFDFLFDEDLFVFAGSETSDLPNDGSDSFLTLGTGYPGLVGVGFFDYVSTFVGDFFVSFDLNVLASGASSFLIDDQTTFFENVVDNTVLTTDNSSPIEMQAAAVNVSEPSVVVLLIVISVMFVGLRRKAKALAY
jgi:hypothetical protein